MDTEYIHQLAARNKTAVPAGSEGHLIYIANTMSKMVAQVSEGTFTTEDVVDHLIGWMCKQPLDSWKTKAFPRDVILEYLRMAEAGTLPPVTPPQGVGESDGGSPGDSHGEGEGEGESGGGQSAGQGEGEDADGSPDGSGSGSGSDSEDESENEGEGDKPTEEDAESGPKSEDKADDPSEEKNDAPEDQEKPPEGAKPKTKRSKPKPAPESEGEGEPKPEKPEKPEKPDCPSKLRQRLKALLRKGFDVMLIGPAGCGKTHDCLTVAKELGLKVFIVASPQMKHELEGYVDAMGLPVATSFVECFRYGGLIIIEEMDASGPDALIGINAALANRVMNIPGVGTVYAHPDFKVVATANTCGLGATSDYNTRNALDRSTLDRFLTLEYDYDYDIELALGGKELADFAESYRYVCTEKGINSIITYRAITSVRAIMEMDGPEFGRKGTSARAAYALDSGLLHSQVDLDNLKDIAKSLPDSIYAKGLKAYISRKDKERKAKKAYIEALRIGAPATPYDPNAEEEEI